MQFLLFLSSFVVVCSLAVGGDIAPAAATEKKTFSRSEFALSRYFQNSRAGTTDVKQQINRPAGSSPSLRTEGEKTFEHDRFWAVYWYHSAGCNGEVVQIDYNRIGSCSPIGASPNTKDFISIDVTKINNGKVGHTYNAAVNYYSDDCNTVVSSDSGTWDPTQCYSVTESGPNFKIAVVPNPHLDLQANAPNGNAVLYPFFRTQKSCVDFNINQKKQDTTLADAIFYYNQNSCSNQWFGFDVSFAGCEGESIAFNGYSSNDQSCTNSIGSVTLPQAAFECQSTMGKYYPNYGCFNKQSN